MRLISIPILLVSTFLLSCGGGQSQIDKIKAQQVKKAPEPKSLAEAEKNWESDHGIGPIKAFTLPTEIDQVLAASGKETYEAMCTACHKAEEKFIGPAPKGILSRRTPAWIMNMILNPDEMVKKNPIAKQLLMKFNGSPMANQNLTEDQARSVLEYFRTL